MEHGLETTRSVQTENVMQMQRRSSSRTKAPHSLLLLASPSVKDCVAFEALHLNLLLNFKGTVALALWPLTHFDCSHRCRLKMSLPVCTRLAIVPGTSGLAIGQECVGLLVVRLAFGPEICGLRVMEPEFKTLEPYKLCQN